MLCFNDDQGFVWLCFLNNRIFLFNGFINTPGRKACLTYEKVIGFAVMYWQVVLTIKSNPRSHAVIINSLNEGMGRLCSLLRCSCNRTDLTVFHLYLYLHSTFKYHIYSKSSLNYKSAGWFPDLCATYYKASLPWPTIQHLFYAGSLSHLCSDGI